MNSQSKIFETNKKMLAPALKGYYFFIQQTALFDFAVAAN